MLVSRSERFCTSSESLSVTWEKEFRPWSKQKCERNARTTCSETKASLKVPAGRKRWPIQQCLQWRNPLLLLRTDLKRGQWSCPGAPVARTATCLLRLRGIWPSACGLSACRTPGWRCSAHCRLWWTWHQPRSAQSVSRWAMCSQTSNGAAD